ncbi:MAG: fimbrillin family protein [Bacteroides sp.]|nr:fimbrillin family protein [Bacteroides sp.]
MTKLLVKTLMTAGLLLAACSEGDFREELPLSPDSGEGAPAGELTEIRISSVAGSSRATDYGFEENDRLGLYVVNYDGSAPGLLKDSGNHVDNMGHTYDGVWTPDGPIYWKDATTHADFYLYYPYRAVTSVSAMDFEVSADQSSEEAYKASDLMRGIATDVAPTASAVVIPVYHLMSRINIKVEAGSGFTSSSLAKADVSVRVNGLQCGSTVSLVTGDVTPLGPAVSVTPLARDGSYVALLVPQSVGEGNLITVTVNGTEFNLPKAFTFESGKSYTFTVVVSRSSNGVNVDISPWDEDDVDYGGTAQ